MNQTLLNMFNKSMEREHQTVIVHYTGETFDCFFRKSNDNTNQKDTMIMYYYSDAPVNVGTLISFRGKTFLVLNKETTENDIYCKSAIIKTTGKINTHNLAVLDLPVYNESINNANASVTTHITVIDGNVNLLTEDNEISRQLKVNDLFNEFGRTWKISNLFYVDKASVKRNFELSFSSEGDPASVKLEFDLMEDKDGNILDMVELTDDAE